MFYIFEGSMDKYQQPSESYISLLAHSALGPDYRRTPHNFDGRFGTMKPCKQEKDTLSVIDNLAITCVSSSDPNEAYAVGIEHSRTAESPSILFVAGNERTVPLLTIQHLEGVCSQLQSIAQLEIDKRPRKEISAASNRLGLYIFTFCHAKILYWLQKFMDESDSGTSEWRSRQIPTREMIERDRPNDPTLPGKWEEVLQSLQALRSAALSSHEQEPDKYLHMWVAARKVTDILAGTPILGEYINSVNKPLSKFILSTVSHARSTRILVSGARSSFFGPLFSRPFHIISIPSEPRTIQSDASAIQSEVSYLFSVTGQYPPLLSPDVIEAEYTNTPHCETTLAMYLLKHDKLEHFDDTDGKSYCIGCSKPTCLACELFFNRLALPPAPRKKFLTSTKSRTMYPHYVFPNLSLLEERRKVDLHNDSVLVLEDEIMASEEPGTGWLHKLSKDVRALEFRRMREEEAATVDTTYNY